MVPAEIHQQLLRPNAVRSVVPLPEGMSGARLFRCEGKQTFALRCWPSGVSPDRVRQIHAAMIPVASTCRWIPEVQRVSPGGNSFAVDGTGAIWDLSTWMAGEPIAYESTFELIAVGAAAISRLHRKMRILGTTHGPAPAIDERVRRIGWLDRHLPECWCENLAGRVHPLVVPELTNAIRLLQAKWPIVSPPMTRSLSRWRNHNLPLQTVLRDVHREHLLFTQGEVSGIIDFDAVRIDTPAVDLARWGASFSLYRDDPQQTIHHVLAGYYGARPLSEMSAGVDQAGDFRIDPEIGHRKLNASTSDFRTLILTIAESSSWISLANWVIWLVGEARQFPDFQRVAERLSRLIEVVNGRPKR